MGEHFPLTRKFVILGEGLRARHAFEGHVIDLNSHVMVGPHLLPA